MTTKAEWLKALGAVRDAMAHVDLAEKVLTEANSALGSYQRELVALVVRAGLLGAREAEELDVQALVEMLTEIAGVDVSKPGAQLRGTP